MKLIHWKHAIALFLGFSLAALCMVTQPAAPQSVSPPATLHAGPLYTAAASSDSEKDGEMPVFPHLQILLDPPDGVQNMEASALQLSVDGQACGPATSVQSFKSAGHSMAAVVVIDVSGSMRGGPLNAIRAGLIRFVNDTGNRDRVAIETVADDSHWDAGWNAPRPQLKAALQSLAVRGHLTRLWDGLYSALNSFDGQPPARRVIVISDGHDEGSQHTEANVIAASVAQHAPIDAIGVSRSNPRFLESLSRLAKSSGGHFRRAANEQQLEQFVGGGISALRNLPLAAFDAKKVKADGKPHRFTVAWKVTGQDVSADLTALVPHIKDIWDNLWVWVAAAGVIVLLAGVVILWSRKSRREFGPAAPVVAPAPAAAAVMPLKSALAAPRPFVPSPSAPPPVNAPTMAGTEARQPGFVAAKTQMAPRFPAPSAGHPTGRLFCEEGSAAGSEFPIEAGEFWIGSLASNHLVLAGDPTISANHACIVFEQGVLGIFDYNSTNGTRVNETLVGENRQLLRPGDVVRIGRSTFVLRPMPVKATGS